MTTTMTEQSTAAIAKTLVEKCRQGQFDEAVKELYAQDIVSIESMEMPGFPKELKGLQAVAEKGRQWSANHEVHSMEVGEPLIANNFFAVRFQMDVTNKPMNQRFDMSEIALYEVKNGKICREEFFYPAEK